MYLENTIDFLGQLRKHNNKSWFYDNRPKYQHARQEFEVFVNDLIPVVRNIMPELEVNSARECMFRIFRDVRFSKVRQPYKTNFGALLANGGNKSRSAGFYIHIEPGLSFVGGGIYMPKSPYLKAIRTEIFENVEEYKGIIYKPEFKQHFGELCGERLKIAPRGFPRDFADIALLRNKHYTVIHAVEDNFWTQANLIDELAQLCLLQRDFYRFLNRAVCKEDSAQCAESALALA